MAEPPDAPDTAQRAREGRPSRTFVSPADTLVADFGVADFLAMLTGQVGDRLEVAAAGVILRT